MKLNSPPLIEVKVILLGQANCGKTSLVNRYIKDTFLESSNSSTIGVSYILKKFPFKNYILGMGLWDTAGSERFEGMARMYYRDAKTAIVCFDVSDKSSYEKAMKWVTELKETCEDCAIYLCATKMDIVYMEGKRLREVDVHDVIEYADSVGAKFFETSSKTGEGVSELFNMIAKDLCSKYCTERSIADSTIIKLKQDRNKKESSCACRTN